MTHSAEWGCFIKKRRPGGRRIYRRCLSSRTAASRTFPQSCASPPRSEEEHFPAAGSSCGAKQVLLCCLPEILSSEIFRKGGKRGEFPAFPARKHFPLRAESSADIKNLSGADAPDRSCMAYSAGVAEAAAAAAASSAAFLAAAAFSAWAFLMALYFSFSSAVALGRMASRGQTLVQSLQPTHLS